MDLLAGLNPPQKEAVLHTEGALLVLAGAGSGKTRVLTHRIAHMMCDLNVRPWNILSITFTNKAAKEMKERLHKIVGEAALDVWMGTFHSICMRILRRDIDKLGYDKSFVIYDSDDQQTLMKQCIERQRVNDKQFPPKSVLQEIGRAKDELVTPDQFTRMAGSDYRQTIVAKLYEMYQKRLKENNAVDFDDIILLTIRLLNEFPEIRRFYQDKFQYVLVDEYQDTNTAQYMLVSMLAGGYNNICVVGDDDQMIYGWRGANLRNILDFEDDFKGCRIIKLEQNYRSTETILEAANHVIRNNRARKQKKLWTENPKGGLIHRFEAGSERDEAFFVADRIRGMHEMGRNYGDFAILYRVNAQTRVLEDILIKQGIPYKILGGLRFYDRKEIKDIISWLRTLQNPNDDISLQRIINVPRRGIGKTTLDKASAIAAEEGRSLWSVLVQAEQITELSRAAKNLASFTEFVSETRSRAANMDLVSFIDSLIERSGMIRELEAENSVENASRIENIREFVSVAREFSETTEDEANLENFLAHVSLVADIDNLDNRADRIVLMTMHSAKGLEFPVVFITGMEEGIFPTFRALTEESDMEEERRLAYVGITRAREELFLLNAQSRMLYGSTQYNAPSRFLKEIPAEFCDGVLTKPRGASSYAEYEDGIGNPVRRSGMANTSNSTSGAGGQFSNVVDINDLKSRIKTFTGPAEETAESVVVGDRVLHKKFGKGVVRARIPEGGDFRLDIQFEGIGTKRLMESFARLKKI